MKDLSHYKKRVLNQLLPPLKKTDPNEELHRICKLYREIKIIKEDEYLFKQFCKYFKSLLNFVLTSKAQFYHLDSFKENYEELANDFILDTIDADESDFIEHYITSQQEIIDKTFKYYIEIKGYKSIEVTQFVSKNFIDEYIPSSRKKIKFLEDKLNKIRGLDSKSEEIDNPYPLLFVSGKVYNKFIEYTSKHLLDVYLDCSYLKKRLEHEHLMHRTKDNEFMRILFEEMGLIKEKDYKDYRINKNKLSSLNKSTSASRENNFNNIFMN